MSKALAQAIGELLRQEPGKDSAMKAPEIAKALDVKDSATWSKIRSAILLAIEVGYPIGTSQSDGYYWISSQQELDECVAALDQRIEETKRRQELLRLAFQTHPQAGTEASMSDDW